MIGWIRKFFTKSELEKQDTLKCSKCGLAAQYNVFISFTRIGEEEEDARINGLCCLDCETELHREFNPMWLPPFILKEE